MNSFICAIQKTKKINLNLNYYYYFQIQEIIGQQHTQHKWPFFYIYITNGVQLNWLQCGKWVSEQNMGQEQRSIT